MKTPKYYYEYLDYKKIPVPVIYRSLYSVERRFDSTRRRKNNCVTIEDIITFDERYGKYDERYPMQRDFLLSVLDAYGIREGYDVFKRSMDREYPCLTYLISAQYVTKLIKTLCEEGVDLIGIPDNAKQKSNGISTVSFGQPVVYVWTDTNPVEETEMDNQSQDEMIVSTEGD